MLFDKVVHGVSISGIFSFFLLPFRDYLFVSSNQQTLGYVFNHCDILLQSGGIGFSNETIYIVEVLLNCSKSTKKMAIGEVPVPCNKDEKGEMMVGASLSLLLSI